jgi:hypothetical protein
MGKMKSVYYVDGQTLVCLLVADGRVMARGLSICSRRDIFTFEQGKKQARDAAMEAFGRQCDVRPIKLGATRSCPVDELSLSLARDRFGEYKGYYMPILSFTEHAVVLKGKCL